MLAFYLEKLGPIPKFLDKYIKAPIFVRLKKVGYFCGMDYASKSIYDFSEYISRYDHSINVALITWKLTKDKKQTIAALYHDIATPCFSHVIDYMNKDYEFQESTEQLHSKILINNAYIKNCLQEDTIDIKDVTDFKKYKIVDNERPKVCADRMDGIILPGIAWVKEIEKQDIVDVIDSMCIYQNEEKEEEIGFKSSKVGDKIIEVSKKIDTYCHSKEDNYMMELLATITRKAILKNYITYPDLYVYNEEELFSILKEKEDLREDLDKFFYIKKEEVPTITLPLVKIRKINPIILNERKKIS